VKTDRETQVIYVPELFDLMERIGAVTGGGYLPKILRTVIEWAGDHGLLEENVSLAGSEPRMSLQHELRVPAAFNLAVARLQIGINDLADRLDAAADAAEETPRSALASLEGAEPPREETSPRPADHRGPPSTEPAPSPRKVSDWNTGPWTDDEVAELRRRHEAGETIQEIGRILRRRAQGVSAKLRWLIREDTTAETEGSEAEGPEGADEPAPGPDVAAPAVEDPDDGSVEGPAVAPVAVEPEEVPRTSGPLNPAVRNSAVITLAHPAPDARPGAVQFHTGMSATEMDRWIRYHDPDGAQLAADVSLVSALARGEPLDGWAAERELPFTRVLRRWKDLCPIPTLGTQTLLLEALKRRQAQEAAA
jgi:hypothetical protein